LITKPILIINGAMGTELMDKGVELPLPLWSAEANINAPEIVQGIHQNYIDAGASWNFTFSKPGEYEYYCTPHPYMRGLIIVLPYEDNTTIATTENENH